MIESTSRSVSIVLVRRFLEQEGWVRAESSKNSFDLYSLGTGKQRLELLLPANQFAGDPERWIDAALRTLSQLLDIEQLQLVDRICFAAVDRIKSRVSGTLVSSDTISFSLASRVVLGMRSLLEAAATTECNPRPFFPRVLKAAKDYVDECRFAHTYRGSFGFVVESPVRAGQKLNLLPGVEPIPAFERRVVERVVRGISIVPSARQENAKELLLENFGAGLSANMCDALAGLVDATQGQGIEFSFELAGSGDMVADGPKSKAVMLHEADADFLRDVSSTMREKRSHSYVELSGQVVALKTRGMPGDLEDLDTARQIAIISGVPGVGPVEVHINLRPADYLEAIEAHTDGRTLHVAGKLQLIGRSWFLLEPRVQQQGTLFDRSR